MAKTSLFAGIFAVFCLVAAARAGIADFTGNWENAGSDASGIAHVVISPAGGDHVSVRVYGTCHPTECNWGLVEGKSYSRDPHSSEVESIQAIFNTGFSRKEIIFRKGKNGVIAFEVLSEFVDGSGRHDFDMTGRLIQSAMAGPVGDTWNRPASQGTGWGGGARTGTSPRPAETCQPFDGVAARVVRTGEAWQARRTHGHPRAGNDPPFWLRPQMPHRPDGLLEKRHANPERTYGRGRLHLFQSHDCPSDAHGTGVENRRRRAVDCRFRSR